MDTRTCPLNSGNSRYQLSGLLAKNVIWIILLIELGIFVLSWPVFRYTQCAKAAMDYWSFASPCLAGIFAGMAVMYQKEDSSNPIAGAGLAGTAVMPSKSLEGCACDVTRKAADPPIENPNEQHAKNKGASTASRRFRLDYLFYIVSLIMLFGGYIAYIWVHFAYTTLVWLFIWTGVVMTIGYLIPTTQRWFAHPHGLSEPATVALGIVLMVMLLALGWFVQAERAVFSGADARYISETCHKE